MQLAADWLGIQPLSISYELVRRHAMWRANAEGLIAVGAGHSADGFRAIATAIDGKPRTSAFEEVDGLLLGAYGAEAGRFFSNVSSFSSALRAFRKMSARQATDSDTYDAMSGAKEAKAGADPCGCN